MSPAVELGDGSVVGEDDEADMIPGDSVKPADDEGSPPLA